MTIPTQAQIEAAMNAIIDCPITRTEMIAALTAAAEVEEQYPNEATLRAVGWINPTQAQLEEVGDRQPDDTFAHGACVMKERCAQVAEEYDGHSGKHGIAAAIRALKDKP